MVPPQSAPQPSCEPLEEPLPVQPRSRDHVTDLVGDKVKVRVPVYSCTDIPVYTLQSFSCDVHGYMHLALTQEQLHKSYTRIRRQQLYTVAGPRVQDCTRTYTVQLMVQL